jgi:hypothetical protein
MKALNRTETEGKDWLENILDWLLDHDDVAYDVTTETSNDGDTTRHRIVLSVSGRPTRRNP